MLFDATQASLHKYLPFLSSRLSMRPNCDVLVSLRSNVMFRMSAFPSPQTGEEDSICGGSYQESCAMKESLRPVYIFIHAL